MSKRAIGLLQQALLPNNGMSSFAPYGGMQYGQPTPTHIERYLAPVQFARLATDIGGWREAIHEMELPFYPMRAKAMRIFIDVVENPEVKPVLDRWDELTLLRKNSIYQNKSGKLIESRDLTQAINEQYWFEDYKKYALDAFKWGYTLISLGDLIDDGFPDIKFIKRENIRPDGIGDSGPILTSLVYAIDGIRVKEDQYVDMFNHWIPTPSNVGASKCGYGLLYNISLLEIHLRHILAWNADFVEGFSMPIKVGSTQKTGKERDEFEAFLASGASNQWILLDKGTGDDVKYEMAQNAGTAWKSYENLADRCKDVLSQLVLGHSDAIKTSKDKLGGNQKSNKDGDNLNLVQEAMNNKQIVAGNFLCRKINEIAAPRFRRIGMLTGSKIIKNLIPDGYVFGLKNDIEENDIKRKENQDRIQVSTWVKNINDAGFDVDAEQLSERLGIKVTPAIPERKLYQVQTRKTESIVHKDQEPENETE
jgi:hypothetical protein